MSVTQAMRCWARDDPNGFSNRTLGQVAATLGCTYSHVERQRRRLAREGGADKPIRGRAKGENYRRIVNFIRSFNGKPPYGYQTKLAEDLDLKIARVHTLVKRARARGDI